MTNDKRSGCSLCGADPPVSAGIGVCAACLASRPAEAVQVAERLRRDARVADDLVPEDPRAAGGSVCRFCARACRIPEGGRGYCGLRECHGGRLQGGVHHGNFSYYHDPLPTNCVADWVCSGRTGAGYPTFALRAGPEIGYKNLAVFSQVCSFDCAFCQNGVYRKLSLQPARHTAEELAAAVDERTTCICFFGGDPTPQMPLFLSAAASARAQRGEGILRICWETNGSMHKSLMDRALALSLESGGCLKFDVKAVSPALHRALTGSDNRRTLDNLARAAARIPERPEPPPVVVSTLLIPGYVGAAEVGRIASVIADLDPTIPYSLLAFSPQLRMDDLPCVTIEEVEACLEKAVEAGLTHINVGNPGLLRA